MNENLFLRPVHSSTINHFSSIFLAALSRLGAARFPLLFSSLLFFIFYIHLPSSWLSTLLLETLLQNQVGLALIIYAWSL